MVQAGASYRVAGAFRAGVEYVGQDLEESFSAGAEGGARHFVGPIASMQLLDNRFTVVAGPVGRPHGALARRAGTPRGLLQLLSRCASLGIVMCCPAFTPCLRVQPAFTSST